MAGLFFVRHISVATLKLLLVSAATMSLASCVLPVPTTLHARGYVRDAVTRKPISGARITLKDHPKATAFTAKDGSFDIPSETRAAFVSFAVPMDPIVETMLSVSAAGYRSKDGGRLTSQSGDTPCSQMIRRRFQTVLEVFGEAPNITREGACAPQPGSVRASAASSPNGCVSTQALRHRPPGHPHQRDRTQPRKPVRSGICD